MIPPLALACPFMQAMVCLHHGNMQIMNKEYSNLEDLVYLVMNHKKSITLNVLVVQSCRSWSLSQSRKYDLCSLQEGAKNSASTA